MKAFRYLTIGFGILLALYLAVCWFGDPQLDAKTSVVLPLPPALIFPFIADLQQREKWNPYDDGDTTVRYRYGDRTTGVGAEYEWTAQSGPGRIRIEEIEDGRLVRETLTFLDFGSENEVTYRLDSLPEGTRVTWSMKGRKAFPYWVRGLFCIGLNRTIDGFQHEGLRQLGAAAGAPMSEGGRK
jgi:uncharacterized protein YndB with AHSA1/START domain